MDEIENMTPEQIMEQWETNEKEYEALGDLPEEYIEIGTYDDQTRRLRTRTEIRSIPSDHECVRVVLPNMKFLKGEEYYKFLRSCNPDVRKSVERMPKPICNVCGRFG